MTDWQSIRTEYEAGASLRSLAAKYTVPKSTIESRAKTGNWSRSDILRTSPLPLSDLSETSDMATIEKAIRLITRRLDEEPDNKDIKMLMDSLSQAYKIRMLVPAGEDFSAFDMREFLAGCTDEELEIVRPVIAAVQARRAEKITPIKKVG